MNVYYNKNKIFNNKCCHLFQDTCREIICAGGYVAVNGQCIKDTSQDVLATKAPPMCTNLADNATEDEHNNCQHKPETVVSSEISTRLDVLAYPSLLMQYDNASVGLAISDTLFLQIENVKHVSLKVRNNSRTRQCLSWCELPLNYTNADFVSVDCNCKISCHLELVLHNLESLIAVEGLDVFQASLLDSFTGHTSLSLGGYDIEVKSVDSIEYNGGTPPEQWCNHGNQILFNYTDIELVIKTDKNRRWVLFVLVEINGTRLLFKENAYEMILKLKMKKSKVVISGTIIVCDSVPYIANVVCPRIELQHTDFSYVYLNRSILYHDIMLDPHQYENIGSGAVHICVSDEYLEWLIKNHTQFTIESVCSKGFQTLDLILRYLTLILNSLSLLVMFLTILTYIALSALRTLPGCNILFLTSVTFLAQFLFTFFGHGYQVGQPVCKAIAVTLHFLFLSVFFWMNAIGYDLYDTFVKSTMVYRKRRKYIPLYSLYAFGLPFLFVTVCFFLDFTGQVNIGYGLWSISIPQNISEQILTPTNLEFLCSIHGCWINTPSAAFIIFGIPVLLLWTINMIFLVRSSSAIRSVQKEVLISTMSTSLGWTDARRYLKMSVLLGATWIFGLLSAFISTVAPPSDIICYILYFLSLMFIVCNCSQGIFIFMAFVCTKKVAFLLKTKFHNLKVRFAKPVTTGEGRKRYCTE